jgi:quercetin dioxygenase-like cupin family protein
MKGRKTPKILYTFIGFAGMPHTPALPRTRHFTSQTISTVKKLLTFCIVLTSLSFWLVSPELRAREPQVSVNQILQTTQSWDGSSYAGYPTGQPQVTVLRITIPPNTKLHWHRHPMISVGYILSGQLTLEKKDTGERKILHAGEALAETVQTTHRGFTTDEPAELIVFYAGQVGLPLSINED